MIQRGGSTAFLYSINYAYHAVSGKEKDMAEEAKEFTPINTQEEFDARIGARLQREREKYADYEELKTKVTQMADYDDLKAKASKYEADITSLTTQLETANTKIKGYESHSVKQRIAREVGIPLEMADRLTGDDEEAIRKDAETLKPFVGTGSVRTLPLHDTEQHVDKDSTKAALRELSQKLKK